MYRKNVASQHIYFCLVNATTGAALTGATVTAYRALGSASQTSATGTTTELANGQYRFDLSQDDTNADYGSYLFTATNAVPVEKTVVFTAADPTDAAAFGLTRIDATITSRLAAASLNTSAGGVFVVGDMFGNNLVISTVALEATSQAIKAKTDLITAGQVQIVSPVGSGGNITTPIFAGDDFKASNGRAFEWTIDARTGFSAGTATCRFGGYSEETGDSWNVAGTVTDIGGGEWRLSFDLTKTVTADLSPGFYRWSVELANPGGDEVTEVYNSNANRQAEVRAKQT